MQRKAARGERLKWPSEVLENRETHDDITKKYINQLLVLKVCFLQCQSSAMKHTRPADVSTGNLNKKNPPLGPDIGNCVRHFNMADPDEPGASTSSIIEEEDEEEIKACVERPGDTTVDTLENMPHQAAWPRPKRPHEDETSSHVKRTKGKRVKIEQTGPPSERIGPSTTGIAVDTEAEENDCQTLEDMMESLRISKKERMEKSDSYVEKAVKMRRSAAVKTRHD